jgi:FtsZ-binding cell division protein ZapB
MSQPSRWEQYKQKSKADDARFKDLFNKEQQLYKLEEKSRYQTLDISNLTLKVTELEEKNTELEEENTNIKQSVENIENVIKFHKNTAHFFKRV